MSDMCVDSSDVRVWSKKYEYLDQMIAIDSYVNQKCIIRMCLLRKINGAHTYHTSAGSMHGS